MRCLHPQISSPFTMRNFFLFLAGIGLFNLGLCHSLQAQKAGEISKVAIPGGKLELSLSYIPAGQLSIKSADGKSLPIQLDAFWIGSREVTYDEFLLFQYRRNDNNSSNWKDGKYSADAVTRPTPQYMDYTWGMGTLGGVPTVAMTQQGAMRYCQWLYQKTGQFFRLPTEAEWEYACRAGSATALPEGVTEDNLGDYAWYFDNANEKYHPTAQKKANAWGLFDMLGNVAEWTADAYVDDYFAESSKKPNNPWYKPSAKYSHTIRGGSFDDNPEDCSCSKRVKSLPSLQKRDPQIPRSRWWNTDSSWLGFRVVKPVKQPSAAEIETYFKEAIVD